MRISDWSSDVCSSDLFSPWRYDVDAEARAMLEASGWTAPEADALPTGGELYERYLKPLAALPEIAGALRLGHRVTAISRRGIDKAKTEGRERAPFVLRADRKSTRLNSSH